MKIFKNKFLVKLIASVCIFLTLLNFGLKPKVYAEDEEVFGGVLLTPVMHLLTAIGDAIMDVLHLAILEQEESLIRLDGTADTWWNRHGSKVLGWLAAIIVVAVVVITAIPSGGSSLVAGGGFLAYLGATCFVIKTAAVAVGAGLVSGFLVTKVVDSSMMADDIYLPVYRVTPEEIFSNELWLFDVNFFNTDKEFEAYRKKQRKETVTAEEDWIDETITGKNDEKYAYDLETGILQHNSDGVVAEYTVYEATQGKGTGLYPLFKKINDQMGGIIINYQDPDTKWTVTCNASSISGESYDESRGHTYTTTFSGIVNIFDEDKEQVFLVEYEKIYNTHAEGEDASTWSEKLNIDIVKDGDVTITESVLTEVDSTAQQLRSTIAKWYFTLRNLALLVLMLVLIYSGIKIVTGSTAGEKAKYKERLMDWLIAMCLVFVLHYIMVFAVELNEKIIELISTPEEEQGVLKSIVLSNENHINAITKDDRLTQYLHEEDGYKILQWGTDLMGGMRLEQQLIYEGTANWVGYVLCYLVLVIFTLTFAWTYLKRVLYMAFLTIIAPLVAMTYPIDKITDGKAQAFNAWLKEYIFNLLIQPFHLLLYVILVGAAYELAAKNPLYAIVAVGFMTPAEKLLRKFFGFNKAQTPGALGGAAGAALAMTGMKSLMKFGSKGSSSKSGNEEKEKQNKIKFSSSEGVNPKQVIANSAGQQAKAEEQETTTAKEDSKNSEETSTGSGGNIPRMQTPPVQTPATPTPDGESKEGNSGKTQSDLLKEETDKIKKKRKTNAFKRTLRAAGAGIGSYGRGLGNKIYKRVNKARPIRSLARGAAGLAGATLFGMAGLALGIASGDPSKAFQYTTAGAVGGMSVGKGLAGRGVDALSVDTQKIKDEVEMSYYGEDYKKIRLQQEKNEMQHDEEYINYIMATLGVSRGEAERILKETGGECFDAGIRNVEDIAAIEQMTRDSIEEEVDDWVGENLEELKDLDPKEKDKKIEEMREQFTKQMEEDQRQHAIAMKKFSDRTPDLSKLGEKKVESYRARFKSEMQKEFYDRLRRQGKTSEEATKEAEELATKAADSIIEGIIKFDDAKSNILKA